MTMTTEHRDSDEERTFRLKAREWMEGRLPPRVPGQPFMDWDDRELVAQDRQIQRSLWDGGLAGITLPPEYGGLGLAKRFEDIFFEEAEPFRLPWHFGNADVVVLPTLLAHGSEYLKKLYIPSILRGDHLWCQLLSEPSGGSDLAGVLTRAEKRDDKWYLNGSKVWTTGGDCSDMGLCLARTDPALPKHAGLTMFLVNMRQPGMSIHPLTLFTGNKDFCQEFLDDVEVPDDHVLGEVNGGWTVAQTQLHNERAGMARGWHIGVRAAVVANEVSLDDRFVEVARELGLADDSYARQLVGEAIVAEAVYKIGNTWISQGMQSGAISATAAAVGSLLASRANIHRSGLLASLTGAAGVAVPKGGRGPEWGMTRVATHRIGGGTLEMQLNSVAERFLGLPREPGDDRHLPFNQMRHNAMAKAKSGS
jgi:alkylation response protein AidB-like acyl-CoA dehydrogenase